MFLAGALALIGFQALVLIPHFFTLSMDAARIGRFAMATLVDGLALPIGIGIFVRRWSALFWAQIYLWLKFFIGCAAIPVRWYFFHETVERSTLTLAPAILIAAALLGLIFWSTSEKFRYEPDA